MGSSLHYDHPNVIVRREFGDLGATTSAGVNAAFASYQAIKLFACHAHVVVAGTSTAANNSLYELRAGTVGTTSIGAFDIGTQAVGVTSSVYFGTASGAGTSMTAREVFSVLKQGGADGQIGIVWEYEVLPDAVFT